MNWFYGFTFYGVIWADQPTFTILNACCGAVLAIVFVVGVFLNIYCRRCCSCCCCLLKKSRSSTPYLKQAGERCGRSQRRRHTERGCGSRVFKVCDSLGSRSRGGGRSCRRRGGGGAISHPICRRSAISAGGA
jgi:hypothetical protein